MSQESQVIGNWSTGTFECGKDEETCWWGSWCCWLLSARTSASFNVGSSYIQASAFVASIFLIFVISTFAPGLVLFFLLFGSVLYAYYRANLRSRIRFLYSIPGTLASDFILHFFCPCCAVCQEAREAKLKGMKKLDFCYGEELSSVDFSTELTTAGSPTIASAEESSDGSESLFIQLNKISKMSMFILKLTATLALIALLLLISSAHAQNFLVLVLVFLQPLLIMYFVYWRKNRKYASLDFVIKLFAVGFFLSTTQSIVFESILEFVLGIVVAILLIIFNPNTISDANSTSSSHDAANYYSSQMDSTSYRQKLTQSIMKIMLAGTGGWTFLWDSSWSADGFDATGAISDYDHYTVSSGNMLRSGNSSVSLSNNRYYSNTFHTSSNIISSSNSTSSSSSFDDMSPSEMRHNIIIIVFALFVMAFVIAAGVEETMKHFAVRCCRFPAPLKNPFGVMIYLMTAALGFATAENIEYVFGTKQSPIPGTSLLVGELFVLLIRVLMPIHLICSVLQAVNLSKVRFCKVIVLYFAIKLFIIFSVRS